jgi:hypothetical protein
MSGWSRLSSKNGFQLIEVPQTVDPLADLGTGYRKRDGTAAKRT